MTKFAVFKSNTNQQDCREAKKKRGVHANQKIFPNDIDDDDGEADDDDNNQEKKTKKTMHAFDNAPAMKQNKTKPLCHAKHFYIFHGIHLTFRLLMFDIGV